MKEESVKTFSYRISQASKTELVVIMYDMAAEYLRDGIDAAKSDRYEEFRLSLKYAKRVIDQLAADLDMQYEISGELLKLYSVMGRYLIKASSIGEDALVNTVIKMLSALRKSFYELSKSDDSGPVMKNTQQVYAGLTYSSGGNSNEYSEDPMQNRGFTV